MRKQIDLPFEEGKIYQTTFSTLEKFQLIKIKKYILVGKENTQVEKIIGFEGIYQKNKELGNCPLGVHQLISEKSYIEVPDVITPEQTIKEMRKLIGELIELVPISSSQSYADKLNRARNLIKNNCNEIW